LIISQFEAVTFAEDIL